MSKATPKPLPQSRRRSVSPRPQAQRLPPRYCQTATADPRSRPARQIPNSPLLPLPRCVGVAAKLRRRQLAKNRLFALAGVVLLLVLGGLWFRAAAGSQRFNLRRQLSPAAEAARAEQIKTFYRRSASVTAVNQISPIERLRNAIIAQESDGNPHLLNASGSGAMGFGQIMPETLSLWSQEILGREITEQEFLSRPDLQIKIMDYKLNEYWQAAIGLANGNEDEAVMRVAAWWYAGDPHQFRDTSPQTWASDTYPSVADYCNQVLARFRG